MKHTLSKCLLSAVLLAPLMGSAVAQVECTWEPVGEVAFTEGLAAYPSIVISPENVPYISFRNSALSPTNASVMKFNGQTWEYVGGPGLGGTGASSTSLALSPDGSLYVAFEGYGVGGTVGVLKLTEHGWEDTGPTQFLLGHVSLAISPDGTPYVAGNLATVASVQRFDGSSWDHVGPRSFSEKVNPYYTKLAISPDGAPYIALVTDGKISVMKFDGTDWKYVGMRSFSQGWTSDLGFAISPDGVPFASYYDSALRQTLVTRFNGEAWEEIGRFNGYRYSGLAFSPQGMLYLVFDETGNTEAGNLNRQATVARYDGYGNWHYIGNRGFSAVMAENFSIDFNSAGRPYVAMSERGRGVKATVMTIPATCAY